jgi:hypothetical protein
VLSAQSLSHSSTSLVQAATQTVIPSLLLYLYMMMLLATCCQQDYLMTCQEALSQFCMLRTGMQTYPTLMLLEQGHLKGNKVSIPQEDSEDRCCITVLNGRQTDTHVACQIDS